MEAPNDEEPGFKRQESNGSETTNVVEIVGESDFGALPSNVNDEKDLDEISRYLLSPVQNGGGDHPPAIVMSAEVGKQDAAFMDGQRNVESPPEMPMMMRHSSLKGGRDKAHSLPGASSISPEDTGSPAHVQFQERRAQDELLVETLELDRDDDREPECLAPEVRVSFKGLEQKNKDTEKRNSLLRQRLESQKREEPHSKKFVSEEVKELEAEVLEWKRRYLELEQQHESALNELSDYKSKFGHEERWRHIQVNTEEEDFRSPAAHVFFHRYGGPLGFIALSLWDQFHCATNLWFLAISVVQVACVGTYETLVPLVIMLILQIVKEGYEGWRRSLHEMALNHLEVDVVDHRRPVLNVSHAHELREGQCVRLKANDVVPADVVLISSSDPDGCAYVNTLALDGHRHLVRRVAIEETRQLRMLPDISQLRGTITCNPPNASLEDFSGFFRCEGHTRLLHLREEQLLLRGTLLKNTEWIFGIVVYRGEDTKLAQNTSSGRWRRFGATTMLLNQVLFPLLALVSALLLALGVIYRSSLDSLPSGAVCSDDETDLIVRGICYATRETLLETLLAHLELLQHVVPVSLFLALEVAWLLQARAIYTAVPGVAVNSAVRVPDLGQLEMCFVETTGTVSADMLKLTMCAVGSKRYGCDNFESLESLLSPHDIEKLLDQINSPPEEGNSCKALFNSVEGQKKVYQRLVSTGKCQRDGLGCLINRQTGQRILRSREFQTEGTIHPRAYSVDNQSGRNVWHSRSCRMSLSKFGGKSSLRLSTASGVRASFLEGQEPPPAVLQRQQTAGKLKAQDSVQTTQTTETSKTFLTSSKSVKSTGTQASKVGPLRNENMELSLLVPSNDPSVAALNKLPSLHYKELPPWLACLVYAKEQFEGFWTSGWTVLPVVIREVAGYFLPGYFNKESSDFRIEHRSFGVYDARQLIGHTFQHNHELFPDQVSLPSWHTGPVDEQDSGDGKSTIGAGRYIKPHPLCTFRDESLITDLLGSPDEPETVQSQCLEDLIRCALVCHHAEQCKVVDYLSMEGEVQTVSGFSSTMPEEEALLTVLASCGFTMLEQRPDHVWIEIDSSLGNEGAIKRLRTSQESAMQRGLAVNVRWDVLTRTMQHDLRHRCMSVMVEDVRPADSRASTPDSDPASDAGNSDFESATLYVKGTGSGLLGRLDAEKGNIDAIKRALADFYEEGARCLILAKRHLDPDEVEDYLMKFHEAKASLTERDRLLKTLADEVERDLEPIGVVAFEERVQKGAIEAMHALMDAGIRICLVTSEGADEALTMANNMKLLPPAPTILRVMNLPKESARANQRLAQIHAQMAHAMDMDADANTQVVRNTNEIEPLLRVTVIVDGASLGRIVLDTQLRAVFLRIVACRQVTLLAVSLSPLMKAKLIELVRSVRSQAAPFAPSVRPLCAAIGCSRTMLSAADIGIAVVGQQAFGSKAGMQARRDPATGANPGFLADFAVRHFCDVQPLFLAVGRTAYHRTSFLITFSFFKAFALIAAGAAHLLAVGAAAEPLFPSPLMPLFQVLTSLVALPSAVIDEDLPTFIVLTFPFLYVPGQAHTGLNAGAIMGACLHGVLRGLLAFAACCLGLHNEAPAVLGFAVYACLLFYSAARVAVVDAGKRVAVSTAVLLVLIFSMGVSALVAILVDKVLENAALGGSALRLAASLRFWIAALLAVATNLAADFTLSIQHRWLPASAIQSWEGIMLLWYQKVDHLLTHLIQRVALAPRAVEEHVSTMWRAQLGLYTFEVPVFFKSLTRVRVRSGGGVALISAGAGGLEDMEDALLEVMPEMSGNLFQDKGPLVNTVTRAIRPWTLRFRKPSHERSFFAAFFHPMVIARLRVSCVFLCTVSLVAICFDLPMGAERVWLAPVPVILTITWVVSHAAFFRYKYPYMVVILWCCLGAWAVVWALSGARAVALVGVAPLLIFVFLPLPFPVACGACGGHLLLSILGVILVNPSAEEVRWIPAHCMRLVVIVGLAVAHGYHLEFRMRRQFLLEFAALQGQQSAQSVLYNMLPQFVADGLLWGMHFNDFTQALDNISVIFCKVDHFADWVGDIQASELVSVLDRMFAAFDHTCERQDVMKIETVSEVYFAASGIDHEGQEVGYPEEAGLKAIEVALDMICIATRVCVTIDKSNARSQKTKAMVASSPDGHVRKPMEIKVGVHCGRVICGVVGARKPQFSLYGDTVNTASRMAHTCPCGGSIQISEEMHELIEDDPRFKWEERTVKVKGKGQMQTWMMVEGKGIVVKEMGDDPSQKKSRADIRKASFADMKKPRQFRSHSATASTSTTMAAAAAAAAAACGFMAHDAAMHRESQTLQAHQSIGLPQPPSDQAPGGMPCPPVQPPPTLGRDNADKTVDGQDDKSRRPSQFGTMLDAFKRRPSRSGLPGLKSPEPAPEVTIQQFDETQKVMDRPKSASIGRSPAERFSIGGTNNLTVGTASPSVSRRSSVVSNSDTPGGLEGFSPIRRNSRCETAPVRSPSGRNLAQLVQNLGASPIASPMVSPLVSPDASPRARSSSKKDSEKITNSMTGADFAHIVRSPSLRSNTGKKGNVAFQQTSSMTSSATHATMNPGGHELLRRPSGIGAKLLEMTGAQVTRSVSLFQQSNEVKWESQAEKAETNAASLAAAHVQVIHTISLTFSEAHLEASFGTYHFLTSSVGFTRQFTVSIWAAGNCIATLLGWAVPAAAGQDRVRFLNALMSAWALVGLALLGLAWLRRRGGWLRGFAPEGLVEARLTAIAGAGGVLLALAEPRFHGVGPGVLAKAILSILMWLAVLNTASDLIFKQLLPINFGLLVVAATLLFTADGSDLPYHQAWELYGLLLLFSVAGLAAQRVREIWERVGFMAQRDVRQAELRAKRLMEEMMPVQIRKRLSDKSQLSSDHRIADEYHRMVLLFSDIAGFTAYSKTVEPEKVVAMLSALFVRYDQWTSQLEIYKLCTIGDAYVCLTEPEVTVSEKDVMEGAERMIQMAQLMHSHLKGVAKSLQIPGLSMRIGLHLGHFVGGVIGSSKLRFDIFGLDVLTAANMESNGVPGEICVSEQLKNFLEKAFPERFVFRFNCAVEVMDRTVLSYLVFDANARVQAT